MKIYNNFVNVNFINSNTLSNSKSSYNSNQRVFSFDKFIGDQISFTGINKFPFKKLGLTLEIIKLSEINIAVEHIQKIAKSYDPPNRNASKICRALFEECLQPNQGLAEVIRDLNGNIIATRAMVYRNDPRPYAGIFGIYILPEWQNMGIGRWLMNDLILKAKKSKMESIVVGGVYNPIAKCLYEKLGFVEYMNNKKYGTCLVLKLK